MKFKRKKKHNSHVHIIRPDIGFTIRAYLHWTNAIVKTMANVMAEVTLLIGGSFENAMHQKTAKMKEKLFISSSLMVIVNQPQGLPQTKIKPKRV